MTPEAIGILWPREEDYPRFVVVCDDEVHPTYDAFVKAVGPSIAAIERSGTPLVKVEFDPDELARWCHANSRQVDSQARASYATLLLAERQHGGSE